MINLQPLNVTNNEIGLGQSIQVKIVGNEVETCVFVTHATLFYLKPLSPWQLRELIHFFPEAPGQYTLFVQWRSQDGNTGWQAYTFNVSAGTKNDLSPHKVTINGYSLWTPSKWESLLLSGHEKQEIAFLKKVTKAGWTVFDIGANLGLYSLALSSLVGPTGHVFSVEANPLCVYFLRTNLAANNVMNCTVLPTALGNSSTSINFTINYGNSNLGVTQASPFYQTKIGHDLLVGCLPFDSLISSYGLHPPNFMKIDVEGAESAILDGMKETLSTTRPLLFIEVHGKQIAEEVILKLAEFNYGFQFVTDLQSTKSSSEMIKRLPEEVTQIFCHP